MAPPEIANVSRIAFLKFIPVSQANSLPAFLDDLDNKLYRGTIRRTCSYVMQPDMTLGVDKHIASALMDVSLSASWEITFHELLRVGPPGFWSPYVPEFGSMHLVAFVEIALLID